jgi:hypothetical protein
LIANKGELEIGSPGGWKARLVGVDTKVILLAFLIVVCLGVAGYGYWLNQIATENAQKQYLEAHKLTQALLATVITNEKAIIDKISEHEERNKDSIGEVTYMLTLDQKKREMLRLEMPLSLRRKLSDR